MKRQFIWFISILVSYSAGVYADESFVADAGVVTIKSPVEIDSKQKLPNFVGISADTAGAKGIFMQLIVIPPGAIAAPHHHNGFEEAVYLMQGKVETRYGPGLEKSVINEAGDFIFIPPNVPHQPRNLSDTEPAIAIISRNHPNPQESIIPYDPGKIEN